MAPSEVGLAEGEARWLENGTKLHTKRRPRTPRGPRRSSVKKEFEGEEEKDVAETPVPPRQSHSAPDVLQLPSPTAFAGPLLAHRSLSAADMRQPMSGAAPAPNGAPAAAPPTRGGISAEFQRCLEEELQRVAHELYRSSAGGVSGNPDDKLNWHEAERKLIRWLFLHSGPFQ